MTKEPESWVFSFEEAVRMIDARELAKIRREAISNAKRELVTCYNRVMKASVSRDCTMLELSLLARDAIWLARAAQKLSDEVNGIIVTEVLQVERGKHGWKS